MTKGTYEEAAEIILLKAGKEVEKLHKQLDGLSQINLLLHAAILNILYYINLGQLENAKSIAHTVLGQLENVIGKVNNVY